MDSFYTVLGGIVLAMLTIAGIAEIFDRVDAAQRARKRRTPITHVPRAVIVRSIKGKH